MDGIAMIAHRKEGLLLPFALKDPLQKNAPAAIRPGLSPSFFPAGMAARNQPSDPVSNVSVLQVLLLPGYKREDPVKGTEHGLSVYTANHGNPVQGNPA